MATPDLLKQKPNTVLLQGRIEWASPAKYEGKYTTHVISPAPDPYSKPQIHGVRSSTRLGAKGEEISVMCALGGYKRKAFKALDKDSGELVSVVPVDNTLDAVE